MRRFKLRYIYLPLYFFYLVLQQQRYLGSCESEKLGRTKTTVNLRIGQLGV